MKFKLPEKSGTAPETPEALLADLRGRTIKGILAHQADMLREYTGKALNDTDVALQMPTGSGKTLVALLIAEWRRRKNNERVVYLCPTNQLVNQVAEQASQKYGMKVRAFTGQKKEYAADARGDYLGAKAVAITSYAALFNTKPFFEDPHVIILDDAHASENYIAGFWSLEISRHEPAHLALFNSLIALLKPYLDPYVYSKLIRGSSTIEQNLVEKFPTPFLFEIQNDLVQLFDGHASEGPLKFEWEILRPHLMASHLYFDSNTFLLRPLIPPTESHVPFSGARQRVYMSATLGEGGDLERITGRKKIRRIAISETWKTRGIGRRLFFFPEIAFEATQTQEFLLGAMKKAGRALVLTTSENESKKLKKVISSELKDFKIFSARQLEDTKSDFTSEMKATAVIANRYDGIDLEGDDCRLLAIAGLPKAVNLQERFFVQRLQANLLTRDRLLTRITQAVGRCTRSENDYAGVILLGSDLNDFFLKLEQRSLLHPEIQAEIEFAQMQAGEDLSVGEMLDLLEMFLDRTDDWNEADEAIITLREGITQNQWKGSLQLQGAVSAEVEYQYAMWNGQYEKAFELARTVIGQLSESALKGYRTLWNYLAGSAVYLQMKSSKSKTDFRASEFFQIAANSSLSVQWFSQLVNLTKHDKTQPQPVNSQFFETAARISENFQLMGLQHNRQFDAEMKAALEGIGSNNASRFEQGQVALGKLLGFSSGKKETSGSPDPWWVLDHQSVLVFEDHSDAKPTSKLSITKARQASTHPNWIIDHLKLPETTKVIPVLISPVQGIEQNALVHLKDVRMWRLEEFRQWVTNVFGILRDVRTAYGSMEYDDWVVYCEKKLREGSATPLSLTQYIEKFTTDKFLGS